MAWPVVALGEVAKRVQRAETPQPGTPYRQIGVRLWGQGAYQRETVDGSETKYPVFYRVQKDDIIVSKIWARNGSVAVVTADLDGSFGSAEFPTYEVDRAVLLPGWFAWFTKTPELWAQCDNLSRGTSGQNRLRPERFLDVRLPLPPLNEQHWIVAKLDKVAELVGEAKGTKANIRREVQALLRALVHGAPEQPHPTVPFGEVALLRPVDIEVEPDTEYQFAGVYSFGRGVFRSGVKAGSEVSYKKLICLERNNFIYPKLMAWEGALGVVPEECVGCHVSPEFPVFHINEEILHPAVVDAYFKDPLVWPSLVGTSKGTNARRRRLHPDTIRAHHIPIPPKGVQKMIRNIVERLNPYSVEKEVTELGALIPALLNRVFNNENASFLSSDCSMRESGIGR